MAPIFSGPRPRPLNYDEQDLHFEMQMWYVFKAHAEHEISLQVTPADFSEEGLEEEEGDRVPFDDITNQLAWSNSTNT